MLPSMPVLFQRDSQSGDNFTYIQSPLAIFTEPPVPKPLSPALKPKASGGRRKKDELPELTSDEENQQEINYVQQYYNKICKLPVEKFTKFKDILANFSTGKESPALLYRKLETLLGEDELVEEFLTFLTPGQAAKVGRLMDHLALTKISKFIQHLQTALARKPAKLRKVMKAVTAAAASGSESDLRQKVEPLIRTNARLLQQFRTLFPCERPAESLYALEHTEEFPESAWASDCGYHRIEMEEEPTKNQKGDSDVTYLHGRVFIRQGRVLRPASATFPGSSLQQHIDRLAPPRDQLLLLPAISTTVDSDDDRRKKSPKRQRAPARTRKDKNKSPERPPKNPDEVCKRTVKVVLDARIEKIMAKREDKEAKGRRKREHSPDDEGTKKKQSRRADAKKTERGEDKVTKKSKTVFDKRKGKTKAKSDADRRSLNSALRSHRRDRRCSVSKGDLKSKPIDDKCNKCIKDEKKLELTDSIEVDKEVTEIMKTYDVNVDSGKKTEITESSQRKDNTETDSESDDNRSQPQNPQEETQNCTIEPNPKCSWTRSEDKTILLVLKAGPECEDTFLKMRELLPHRSLQELRERFVHVMDLLRSMALGELT